MGSVIDERLQLAHYSRLVKQQIESLMWHPNPKFNLELFWEAVCPDKHRKLSTGFQQHLPDWVSYNDLDSELGDAVLLDDIWKHWARLFSRLFFGAKQESTKVVYWQKTQRANSGNARGKLSDWEASLSAEVATGPLESLLDTQIERSLQVWLGQVSPKGVSAADIRRCR